MVTLWSFQVVVRVRVLQVVVLPVQNAITI
ncbi:MAG: hypothetical protein SCARUB_03879 [Candidatus Scalindua rubra]|uniref:Uncharacterized protein n=1 Tax=Candidatus Scalindua rubra TaxID=1872076 RepID=A0A1E3X5Y1_9BACT|nr:MAG: hypothetical protein SCARUB_03879 [Candidatus Scalindua rubra]